MCALPWSCTVDWTRWRHKTTAEKGPAPRSCIGPRTCQGRPCVCLSLTVAQQARFARRRHTRVFQHLCFEVLARRRRTFGDIRPQSSGGANYSVTALSFPTVILAVNFFRFQRCCFRLGLKHCSTVRINFGLYFESVKVEVLKLIYTQTFMFKIFCISC